MNSIAQAGRRGEAVRSDCWVQLERTTSGGITVELHSKVDSMYGHSIKTLVNEELRYLGIESAKVIIEDAGALPFVLMARLEAACRRLDKTIEKEFLPDFRVCNGKRTVSSIAIVLTGQRAKIYDQRRHTQTGWYYSRP